MEGMDMDMSKMSRMFGAVIKSTVGTLGSIAADEFNTLLMSFLQKLQSVYKEIPELSKEICTKRGILEKVLESDSSYMITHFYKLVSPHVKTHKLGDETRDDFIMFILPQISILKTMRITDYWQHTDENTKSAIWEYIKNMWAHSYHYSNAPTQEELGQQAMNMFQQPEFHASMQAVASQIASGFAPAAVPAAASATAVGAPNPEGCDDMHE